MCSVLDSRRLDSSYHEKMLQNGMVDVKIVSSWAHAQVFRLFFDSLDVSCNHNWTFYISYPHTSVAYGSNFSYDQCRGVLDSPFTYGMSLQEKINLDGAFQ